MKYKLTDETVKQGDVILYRIQQVTDDASVGEIGGFVQGESNLSQDGGAWVSGDAQVSGDARVYGDAHVYGNALVYGNARVYGNAWVSGDAQVSGDARVSGNAQVYGDAHVYGNALVYGNARVYGDAHVYGNALVYGNARVYGDAHVSGDARVFGDAWEKSPLQVQGTKHFFCMSSITKISIGCQVFNIAYWLKNFNEIGVKFNYTPGEIEEYRRYISLAVKMYGVDMSLDGEENIHNVNNGNLN